MSSKKNPFVEFFLTILLSTFGETLILDGQNIPRENSWKHSKDQKRFCNQIFISGLDRKAFCFHV